MVNEKEEQFVLGNRRVQFDIELSIYFAYRDLFYVVETAVEKCWD